MKTMLAPLSCLTRHTASSEESFPSSRFLFCGQFLKARIVADLIPHRIEPQRHAAIHPHALIHRLRLGSRENLLETRITSERIPFPAQTKLSNSHATRIIRVTDRPGSGT